MYKWSSGFEKSRAELLEILAPYNDKVIILSDNKDTSLFNLSITSQEDSLK
jgi:hypothetical protein